MNDENQKSFLDKDILAKIKGIQLKAKHLVNTSFAGEYRCAFRGRGIEFDELREYQIGDDVRTIDWNVTARNQKPFVKIFKDERELVVMFMVDVSGSSQFGTTNRFKNEVAAEITALLAYLALRNHDKVGLIIFSDHVEHYLPPKKGRGHVWSLIRDILTYKSKAHKTDMNIPLEFLNKVIQQRAITFLISDFQESGYEKQLQTTAKHHEVVAISITDPKEVELPASIGYLELEDAETGEFLLVDTFDQSFLKAFTKKSKALSKARKDFFHSSGIDLIEINTGEAYINPILRFFKSREERY